MCAYGCVCPRTVPTTSVLPWLLILLTEDWIHYSASWSQSWTVVIAVCQGQTLRRGLYWIFTVFFTLFHSTKCTKSSFFNLNCSEKLDLCSHKIKWSKRLKRTRWGQSPGKICAIYWHMYICIYIMLTGVQWFNSASCPWERRVAWSCSKSFFKS